MTDAGYNRLFAPVKTISTEKPRDIFKIDYINRGIDLISLANIFHQEEVKNVIPPYFQYTEPPIISYKYTQPIGPKIFNFSKAVKEFDLSKHKSTQCNCEHSPYKYLPLGHVVRVILNLSRMPN